MARNTVLMRFSGSSILSCSRVIFMAVAAFVTTSPLLAAQQDGWRTIEIETSEVSGADVAISPDGSRLVFTLLGHLFELPVGGGVARQLTSGPYQHSNPAFSPDGSRLAFSSNRGGTDANIFVMDLDSGSITQVTHEQEAERPAWSPDGNSIAYVSELARGHHCPSGPARLRRVDLASRETETLPVPQGLIRSVFFLEDGRPAWLEFFWGDELRGSQSRLQTLTSRDSVATIRTVGSVADRAVPAPETHGFYLRGHGLSWEPVPGFLSFAGAGEGGDRNITSLRRQGCPFSTERFAVAPDGRSIYLADAGRLWKVSLAPRTREPIPFTAHVAVVVREPTPPPTLPPPRFTTAGPIRSVITPVQSPADSSLIFGAAGFLWKLSPGATAAHRLFADDSAFERDPAFSPDGKRLVFTWSDGWRSELRTLDLNAGDVETLTHAFRIWDPAWSPDGRRIVFTELQEFDFDKPGEGSIVMLDPSDGKSTDLAVGGLDDWSAHPRFSADGRALYYAAAEGGNPSIYRTELGDSSHSARRLELHLARVHRPVISSDGALLAYRHNSEIWVARLEEGRVVEGSERKLSDEGGEGFSLSPDGSSVLYSTADRVVVLPIGRGERRTLVPEVELDRRASDPLLIRRVRVLEFSSGGFGPETSILIVDGRIRAIGDEDSLRLPDGARVIDAGGRFAIPGLFEMHAHIMHTYNGSWLAYGITTLCDVGGPLGWIASLADRGELGRTTLPRLFFSGDILHGEIIERDAIVVTEADEARRYVREFKDRGVHFIKTHPGLQWQVQEALVDEAHKLHLPVVEHALPLDYLLRSVTVGGASVEHMQALFPYADDVLQLLEAAGTHWTPTLTVTSGPAVAAVEAPEWWVDDRLRMFVSSAKLEHLLGYGMSDDPLLMMGFWRSEKTELRHAWLSGVRLQLGTDAPYGAEWSVPGASIHTEMEAFAEAGIPPLQVLKMTTLGAATALGVDGWSGSLEIGKVADIVLLDSNPLDDIRNTRKIWRVVKSGRLIDPSELSRGQESDPRHASGRAEPAPPSR